MFHVITLASPVTPLVTVHEVAISAKNSANVVWTVLNDL